MDISKLANPIQFLCPLSEDGGFENILVSGIEPIPIPSSAEWLISQRIKPLELPIPISTGIFGFSIDLARKSRSYSPDTTPVMAEAILLTWFQRNDFATTQIPIGLLSLSSQGLQLITVLVGSFPSSSLQRLVKS